MRRPRGLLIGLVVALTASVTAVVGAAAPASAAVGTVTVNALSPTEGTALSNVTVATFTSTTPVDTFTPVINWGDGTVTIGTVASTGANSFSVKGSHTYSDEGSFAVSVAVQDPTDSTASAGSNTASVAEADSLTAGTLPAITPLEGSNFFLP